MRFTCSLFSIDTEVVFIQKYLVFGGKTGWIGIQLVEMLKAEGKDVTAAASRIENLTDVSEVTRHIVRCVLNASK
jgi:hypothetical protein